MNTISCYFDGACKGNPDGTMGMGAVIIDGSNIHKISSGAEAKMGNSNNVAEYLAFIEVLNYVDQNFGIEDEIIIKGDSNLVIMQMTKRWKIKEGAYTEHAKFALDFIDKLKPKVKSIGLGWIPREENELADELSNKGAASVEKKNVIYFV
jgi:ribonuclease HI